jgi:hypothetical protein
MQGFFNFLYAAEDWIVIIALVEKFWATQCSTKNSNALHI